MTQKQAQRTRTSAKVVADELTGAAMILAGSLVLSGLVYISNDPSPFSEHLLFHLGRRSPRPNRPYHHDLESEIGVFRLAELEVREQSGREQCEHKKKHQGLVLQCPFGQIEMLHFAASCAGSSCVRTFSPAKSL